MSNDQSQGEAPNQRLDNNVNTPGPARQGELPPLPDATSDYQERSDMDHLQRNAGELCFNLEQKYILVMCE